MTDCLTLGDNSNFDKKSIQSIFLSRQVEFWNGLNSTNESNCILHISGCSRQDSIQIGEIYFKTWSGAAENPRLLHILEEDCIQNYMYHCVLANKKTKIFEPLLGVLMPFHSSKNNKKVQKMLQSLWEPLLWRYLKVANSDVRCNATQILSEAFPLEDPEAELEVRQYRMGRFQVRDKKSRKLFG